ncbi:MAG: hypothetical protein KJO01_07920 [Gammaproteobacteria bacterium]|nr:hypothetical protein [Gammaproteobacteria bacterium]MBT8111279.1 hypothetical protein [Gammaproteobacteria bacterium]NNL45977.1 hypothetical protein [Woeseiaceae bacterium]
MPANRLLSILPMLLLAAVVGAAVPRPLDPVVVAPHIYELVFENDKVRVLRQTVRNGETSALHGHLDRVMVYLQSCAWLEDDGAGGEQMQLFKIGDAVWAPAETHGGTTADVVQECKILEIELL